MYIKIYHVNYEADINRNINIIFESYEKTKNLLNADMYYCVFEGEVEAENLEEIFCLFQHHNPKCPAKYKAHSMSVSDVVEVIEDESGNVETGFHYCDMVGFVKFDLYKKVDDNNREVFNRVLALLRDFDPYEPYDEDADRCFQDRFVREPYEIIDQLCDMLENC